MKSLQGRKLCKNHKFSKWSHTQKKSIHTWFSIKAKDVKSSLKHVYFRRTILQVWDLPEWQHPALSFGLCRYLCTALAAGRVSRSTVLPNRVLFLSVLFFCPFPPAIWVVWDSDPKYLGSLEPHVLIPAELTQSFILPG